MTETVLVDSSEASSVILFRTPKSVRWAPQPDVTVYELALCMNPLLSSMTGARDFYIEDMIAALPEGARRHFAVSDS